MERVLDFDNLKKQKKQSEFNTMKSLSLDKLFVCE